MGGCCLCVCLHVCVVCICVRVCMLYGCVCVCVGVHASLSIL